ncbi:MAG: hypothetical protein AB7O52_15825 [Planctomycetota bacterium]
MASYEFAVVSKSEARRQPFPYVYVEDDGTYRDLAEAEREYLQEAFHPADGDRPYVKWRYGSRTPTGSLQGFLKRSRLPKGMRLGDPRPARPWWRFW